MSTSPMVSIIIPAYNEGERVLKALNSILAQTMPSFECIVVNDGSTDNTEEVVKKVAEKDDRIRLINQDNAGTGAARNRGMEEAEGKYLVFYDADDIIPKDALENLTEVAETNDSDLVIGGMLYSNMYESHQGKALLRITEKKLISPYDDDLTKTASACNKLFRRDIIIDNNIRFVKLRRAEDLTFCLQYEGCCRKINGCEKVVYNYRRRPFWEDSSLMQINDLATYQDVVDVHQEMLKVVKEAYEKRREELGTEASIELEALDNDYHRFLSKLYCRFVRSYLMDDIYRYAWTADPTLIEKMQALISEYRQHIFPMDWYVEIVEGNSDLPMKNDNILDLQELAENPVISYGVHDIEDAETLRMVIGSIYSQSLPAFEVLVHRDTYELLSEDLKEMINIYPVDCNKGAFRKTALKECKGKYIWFMNGLFCLSRFSAGQAVKFLEKRPEHVFMTCPLVNLKDGEYRTIDPNMVTFQDEFMYQKVRTAFNQMDYVWGNKLFRVSKLRSMNKLFEKDDWATLDRMFRTARYARSRHIKVMTDLTENDIMSLVHSFKVKLLWRSKLKQEQRFQEMLENRTRRKRRVLGKLKDRSRFLETIAARMKK